LNGYKLPPKGEKSNGNVDFTSSKRDLNQNGRYPSNVIFEESPETYWSRFFYCPKPRNEKHEGITNGKNTHPTVKPIELMQYLVRMFTPKTKDAICLDGFGGSGTTAKACIMEGIKFIYIEKEKEYYDIAVARIRNEFSKLNNQISIAA
jgi:DNA modification methylase